MERWTGKVAVVTGASSGIGLATAKTLVQKGMIVIGLARRFQKMENEMKTIEGSENFFAKLCDVTKESNVIQSFDWIEKKFGTVHILVNNAGVIKFASIEEMKTDDMHNIFNVNVLGLLYCSRQALKLMKKNGHEAHIININSLSGHQVPNPIFPINVYPATKHAVTAISESLINEIRSDKIKVTSISPGFVNTNIFDFSGVKADSIPEMTVLNPEDVAASILHVIAAPSHVHIFELKMKSI